jgi:hypothetical protein
LIDVDDLVEQLDAVDGVVLADRLVGVLQFASQRRVEDVVDQRTLAGARHAGDADKASQRDRDGEVFQVVLPSTVHDQKKGISPITRAGRW